ncbi:unnamed protein product [Prunus armeniaca]
MGKCSSRIENLCLRDLNVISLKFAWVDDPWEKLDAKKNTWGPCRQLKTAKVTRVTNSHINIGYDERHRAAPTTNQHRSLAHDIGHVVRTHCPMKWKSLKIMPDERMTEVCRQLSKKAKANKGNRDKKTLLHHSDSRSFSYRMEARQRGGSKFPKIDVFGNVYVRLGNELVESLHETMMEKSQLVLHKFTSQLPLDTPLESMDPLQDVGFQILMETLDQTLGMRPWTYCRGMGNAQWREPRAHSSSQSNSQVIALTVEVAELNTQLASYSTQMSQLLESLARSDIPISHFGPSSTSEPLQLEHGHHTSTLVDSVQTSEPHLQDDHIDFGIFFY